MAKKKNAKEHVLVSDEFVRDAEVIIAEFVSKLMPLIIERAKARAAKKPLKGVRKR